MNLPKEDRYLMTRKELLARIDILYGGRVAEEVVFGKISNGAANDIERASALARKMVCEWGMSEKIGPLAMGKNEEELFLGREVTKHNDYSEKMAQEIDEEIRTIIMRGMDRAEQILNDNIDELHKLSEELLEREILDADEIHKILNGEVLPPTKRNGNNDSSSKEEEIPSHVKEMLEKKANRSSSDSNTPKENDSN